MSRRAGSVLAWLVTVTSLTGACAREAGERRVVPPPATYTAPPPMATPPPLVSERPRPTATAPPLPPPSASTTPSAPAPMSPKELFRAQDACLDHCDQFACMKVADAYRQGSGVPMDVLAGRRYAIHACLECGAPGLAIVDQCPQWGVADKKKK